MSSHTLSLGGFISISGGWMLLHKELMVEESPHITMQRMTTFLTPSLPRCHLKTTYKIRKFETFQHFGLHFRIGM